MDAVQAKLDAARKELLDLSLRNTLINYRPLKSKGVEIVDELPVEIFRILVTESKTMSFLPIKEEEDQEKLGEEEPLEIEDSLVALLEQPEEEELNDDGVALRHVDIRLQTPYKSTILQKRLLNTFYAARTHIEEQGVNILYLALGMLQWYESERSEIVRLAPLVLVPVELYRTNVRTRFRIRYSQDDIGDNVSLAAKLKNDFAVEFPQLSQDEDLDILVYFDRVKQAIATHPRWSVDQTAIALAFFSFGRFLMYNDLDSENWPIGSKPSSHPIMRAVLEDGFAEPSLEIPDDALTDSYVSPQESFQVVDADSSQTLTILDVNNGRNLVIQGPPGTGKSQTITNLIAEALGQDKTVLFVAEKMAALEVVKRRLDEVGLGDACLELHSHKANKKAFLEDLRRTVELGKPKLDDFTADIQALLKDRDRLNAYSKAVNTQIGKSGITPYFAFGYLLNLRTKLKDIKVPTLDGSVLQSWTDLEARQKLNKVEKLQVLLKHMNTPVKHPFWGCQVKTFLPADKRKIQEASKRATRAIHNLQSTSNQLAEHLSFSKPKDRPSVDVLLESTELILQSPDLKGIKVYAKEWLTKKADIEESLKTGSSLAKLHQQGDKWLIPEAWNQDVLQIRKSYVNYGSKWWRFLSSEYREANREFAGLCKENLPDKIEVRIKLIDKILEAQRLQPVFSQHEPLMQKLFGSQWQGLDSDWDTLENIFTWLDDLYGKVKNQQLSPKLISYLDGKPDKKTLGKFHPIVEKALEEHNIASTDLVRSIQLAEKVRFGKGGLFVNQPFARQVDLINTWEKNVDRLQEIVSFNHLASELNKEGLFSIINLAATWPEAKNHLTDLVKRSWYEELVAQAVKERPELNIFDGSTHEITIDKFIEADLFSFQVNRAQLSYKHWEQLPRREARGQLGILQREFEKRRRHKPIRRLMTLAGNAIQAIKPVFMMSPLSIAMFIPPEALHFDLIVFDEASQVRPVEAFGAILRGRQVIVVGDNRQLPPTNFFQQIVEVDDEDEESPTADLESVLGLFSAQGAPNRMLRWHYRSRHESLIAVSNYEFYENKLVIFPSPDAERQNLGVVYHYLPDTAYDRGRSRVNQKEALAVAEAVMQHAQTKPHMTLGVAAFSVSQMRAIQDQLEYLRRQDPSTEEFFNDHAHEPFFVKNLENVQGDERDVIFISVGYGRSADGHLTMNFGPLNRDGGERRLNVLITRARYICEVFTNLTPDDIDLNKTRARGVIALKRYLKFAQDGHLDLPIPSGQGADSPFEEAVAEALQRNGYEIVHQVGSAGFFIDLAVVDDRQPGRYLIGIECDGATYHSARSARDRDRLRQQVLENMGWRIHRIWSTDWFRNPDRELVRAIKAIEVAKASSSNNNLELENPANETTPSPNIIVERTKSTQPQEEVRVKDYQIAELKIVYRGTDLHEVPVNKLANWVHKVVEVESPVHIDEVSRRIADAYGVKRIGSRIRKVMEQAINYAERSDYLDRRGIFLWKKGVVKPEIVRSHGQLPDYSRTIDQIAPQEIMLAIEIVTERSLGMQDEEISQAACSLLGFGRTSKDMKRHVDKLVERMVSDEILTRKGDYLIIAKSG